MIPFLASGFLWFEGLAHIDHSMVHIAHALVVSLFLVVLGLLYKKSFQTIDQEIEPAPGFSLKNVFQTFVEGLYDLFKGIIPHHTEDYFPLLGGLFFYIFTSNLLGVIPGFAPPTLNFSHNLAMGLVVFAYYHIMGVRRTGLKTYLEHFIGPDLGKSLPMIIMRFAFLAPLMLVIEVLSHSIRPVSLSLRLFGNINGDHLVLAAFSDLAPLVVPVIFLAFGIFVAFVQAFVFTLLSSIYIGLAVQTHDH